ncbi:MAG: polyprenyl synthetase family protein [Akkermansiaceae bacterium]|nr:polyprenyl synthetase family protein [Akkermansiaceae bacterium]MCP5542749.1 polyprenyl synthetase family protein [Akkermansiaceae bacterium]MCP5548833.1 polyprenyl synthetase family protein [Akkermansiaceae bacterium]
MNSANWWARRASCAKVLLTGAFENSMGPMDRVEPRLAAAVQDLLARPGSMVRAVTAYLVGLEMGVAEEAARALACGVEYLHTASLVFDDLPAMDDARLRRGAPCLHIAHGEAVAMLAALAMINRGYALLWQGMRGARPQRRGEAADWVDARLGLLGVIGGQSHDLRGWRGQQSAAEVSEVAARKTGDLLRLTIVLPAIVGGGTDREIQLLDRLALLRGLAYQAADDLKDVLVSETGSGKTGNRDEELGRPNLILAEGFQATLRRFKRLRQTGDRVQAALPGPAERWGMLAPLRVTLPTIPQIVLPASASTAG